MRKAFYLAIAIIGLMAIGGCSKLKEKGTQPPPGQVYLGSTACMVCHADTYNQFLDTGHSHVLTKVARTAPSYPHSSVPDPPPGFAWSDISYVIGGYGWKARFMDNNGYMITGDQAQYNLANQQWAPYEPSAPSGTKQYGCGMCHTTAYEASETAHEDGLEGIIGTWVEAGVTCEACHGPGYQHVRAPADSMMIIDRSSGQCGGCHHRTADHRILASDGLIENEAQYDEMLGAGHSNLLCVQCHDPHQSTRYNAAQAIVRSCSDCHPDKRVLIEMGNIECIDCHMPFSVKTAISSGSGVHMHGDMRSHIFKINSDTTLAQFYVDNDTTYSRGFNGLNFACFSEGCHSARDLAFAADNAPYIH